MGRNSFPYNEASKLQTTTTNLQKPFDSFVTDPNRNCYLLEIFPSTVKSNLHYLIFRFTILGIVHRLYELLLLDFFVIFGS